jgi:preprotein translocase subunit SecB
MSDGPRFLVKGQYIKDFSFENPNAPQSLLTLSEPPKIDVNVNLRGQKMQDNVYELTLHITTQAVSAQNQALFLADLSYAGIFHFTGIPPEQIEQVLLIDCPFVLFPFARRVIADATRDGGFPPLMLDPIDFHSLYLQNRDQVQKGA